MKKLIILIAFQCYISTVHVFAQSSYNTPLGSPDYNFLQQQLEVSNRQYESGSSGVIGSYKYLKNISLFNKYNKIKLQEYQKQADQFFKNGGSSLDYSNPINVNKANGVSNVWMDDKNIITEMKVIDALFTEINQMKLKNPETFTNSKRYKELIDLISEISICSPEQIKEIAFKYGIF